jgi:hypothetical protein
MHDSGKPGDRVRPSACDSQANGLLHGKRSEHDGRKSGSCGLENVGVRRGDHGCTAVSNPETERHGVPLWGVLLVDADREGAVFSVASSFERARNAREANHGACHDLAERMLDRRGAKAPTVCVDERSLESIVVFNLEHDLGGLIAHRGKSAEESASDLRIVGDELVDLDARLGVSLTLVQGKRDIASKNGGLGPWFVDHQRDAAFPRKEPIPESRGPLDAPRRLAALFREELANFPLVAGLHGSYASARERSPRGGHRSAVECEPSA